MLLFPLHPDQNLLPHHGEVHYFRQVWEMESADTYFRRLADETDWRPDESVIYGKHITTKRKVAWHGDRAFTYRYSGSMKTALPWNPLLLEIKHKAEFVTGESYNSCLLNLYHNGSEGMGWHTDAEKEMKPDAAIASISLGAERTFLFKHKTSDEKLSVFLEHGSLLLMKGETQRYWLHRLPPAKQVNKPRINLTFRTIVNQ